MKKHDTYKPTKIEFLDSIPEHWYEKRMRFIGHLFGGLSGKSANDFNQTGNKDNKFFIPFTNIAGNLKINTSDLQPVVVEENENQNSVQKGDLFFLMSSEDYNDVGKSSVLADEIPEETYLNSFCKGFRITDNEVVPEYLNYHLHSKQLRYNLLTEANGFTRINLKIGKVQDLFVAFPPPTEQTAIASYLDHKTTEIDELIVDKKRLLELYEEEKTAIINQAVTKGINPEVKLKDSGIEWLGEIPEHWEVKRLKYVIKGFESGVSVNSLDSPINKGEFGILKTSCVYDYTFRPEENKVILNDVELKRAKTNPKEGRIIISRMNTPELVGASGYVGKNYPNLFLPDRLWQTVYHDNVVFDSKWLSYILKSMNFRKLLSTLATGTSPSMKNIGQEDVLNILIPFPLELEQQSIVRHIETECARIDTKVAKTEKLINLLKEYRTALISEVVTGKVKVID